MNLLSYLGGIWAPVLWMVLNSQKTLEIEFEWARSPAKEITPKPNLVVFFSSISERETVCLGTL